MTPEAGSQNRDESTRDVSADEPQTPGRQDSYGKVAKIGAMWSMARQSIRGLVALPVSMVLARLLTPQDFGVGAAVNLVIQLSTRLTQVGFNIALVRLDTLRPAHEAVVFLGSLAIGVTAFLVLWLGATPIGLVLNSPDAARALPFAALTFLIAPFGTVPAALLARQLRFKDSATADFIGLLSAHATSLSCAAAGLGYWSLVLGALVGQAGATLTRVTLVKWQPRARPNRQAWHDLMAFGSGIQAKRLLEFAGQNLDTLIVGKLLGMSALGLYDKSFSLMNTVAQRLVVDPGASFRILSLIRDDRPRFLRAYERLVGTLMLGAVPLFTFLCICAPELMVFLFGTQWSPAAWPFRVLAASGVLQILTSATSPVNEAAGQIWAQVWRQAAFAVLVVVLVSMGAWLGITGAAAGVLCAGLARTGLMLALLRQWSDSRWGGILAPLMPGTVVGVLLAALLIPTRIVLTRAGVGTAGLLAADLGLVVTYGASAFLWFPMRSVRVLIDDVVTDLAPRRLRQVYRRFARRVDV